MNEFLRSLLRGAIVCLFGLTCGLIGVGLIAALAAVGGCSRLPSKPVVTTVTVTEYRAIDHELTDPLAIPLPVDLVGDHLEREKSLESILTLANCHRVLAAKLSAGEAVDKRDCDQWKPH
jgi:hypothetical protein